MLHWYIAVMRQYARFRGRARRREFWYFTLANVLISLLLAVVGGVIGAITDGGQGTSATSITSIPYTLYLLAIIVPSIAVTVRRLHDTGRSGWWLLLSLVPIAGIVLLVFYCMDSQPGENKYGPNPKQINVPQESTIAVTTAQ